MREPHRLHRYEPSSEEPDGRFRLRWLIPLAAAALWFWRRRHRGLSEDAESPPKEEIALGHRPSNDMRVGAVVIFGIGLAALIVLVLVTVALLTDRLGRDAPQLRQVERAVLPVPNEAGRPKLQSEPAAELLQVRERERRRLSGYRWVDSAAGIVAIPIEQAMMLRAERGRLVDAVLAPDTAAAAMPPAPTDAWRGGAARDSIRLLTESGYVYRSPIVPAATAPPFLGLSPEPYIISAELAEILDYMNVRNETTPMKRR